MGIYLVFRKLCFCNFQENQSSILCHCIVIIMPPLLRAMFTEWKAFVCLLVTTTIYLCCIITYNSLYFIDFFDPIKSSIPPICTTSVLFMMHLLCIIICIRWRILFLLSLFPLNPSLAHGRGGSSTCTESMVTTVTSRCRLIRWLCTLHLWKREEVLDDNMTRVAQPGIVVVVAAVDVLGSDPRSIVC